MGRLFSHRIDYESDNSEVVQEKVQTVETTQREELTEEEPTTEEEHDDWDDWDDENTMVVRCKWIADGCATIDAIIDRLMQEAQYYRSLKQQGWEVTSPVEDDYGYLRKNVVASS